MPFPLDYVSNKTKESLSFIYLVLPGVANVFNMVSKKKGQGISRPRKIMTSVTEVEIIWRKKRSI